MKALTFTKSVTEDGFTAYWTAKEERGSFIIGRGPKATRQGMYDRGAGTFNAINRETGADAFFRTLREAKAFLTGELDRRKEERK